MRTPTPSSPVQTADTHEKRLRELDRKTAAQAVSTASLPNGIVKRAIRTTAPPSTLATTAGAAQPVMSLDAHVLAGRCYRVSVLNIGVYGNGAATVEVHLTYTTNGTVASTASTVLKATDVQVVTGDIPNEANLGATYAPTADGPLSVLLSYFCAVGATTVFMIGSAAWPIEILIEDIGVDPGASGTNY